MILSYTPIEITAPGLKSAAYAISAWANECERKLLNLHCGQFLGFDRHKDFGRLKAGESVLLESDQDKHKTYQVLF